MYLDFDDQFDSYALSFGHWKFFDVIKRENKNKQIDFMDATDRLMRIENNWRSKKVLSRSLMYQFQKFKMKYVFRSPQLDYKVFRFELNVAATFMHSVNSSHSMVP